MSISEIRKFNNTIISFPLFKHSTKFINNSIVNIINIFNNENKLLLGKITLICFSPNI